MKTFRRLVGSYVSNVWNDEQYPEGAKRHDDDWGDPKAYVVEDITAAIAADIAANESAAKVKDGARAVLKALKGKKNKSSNDLDSAVDAFIVLSGIE